MADHTHIEWTDATWNPVTGCSVVSPGCTNCYAMKLAGTRLKHHPSRAGLTTEGKSGPVWNGKLRFNEGWLDQPLRWKKPRMIFVCAHGDLFHPDVPDSWIDQVFAVMALCPHHTFQVLTKRPERMREYFAAHRSGDPWAEAADAIADLIGLAEHPHVLEPKDLPLPNVWLGTSVEDQRRADERIPHLRETPAAVRFLSAEPLLGPIDVAKHLWPVHPSWPGAYRSPREAIAAGETVTYHRQALISRDWAASLINWVIVGGESGDGSRPMHPDWARTLRDQCAAAGVPFFFKQWGSWAPDTCGATADQLERAAAAAWDGTRFHYGLHPTDEAEYAGADVLYEVGKKAAGRLLDGIEHNGMPGPDRHD